MKRIEFVLSMPNCNSWNGRWSGEGRHYAIVRPVSDKLALRLLDKNGRGYWHHSFGDGWAAGVSARLMGRGERARKSCGFYGYDWMVWSILRCGEIEPRPAASHATQGDADATAPGGPGLLKPDPGAQS